MEASEDVDDEETPLERIELIKNQLLASCA